MRKSNREIKDFKKVAELLYSCQTIRLGLNDTPYPYVVPLSFGMETDGEKIMLYFHGAKEGKKVELIKRDNHVCVEADILRGYKAHDESVTADYKSIIAFGVCEELTDFKERAKGIRLLLEHCGTAGYSAEECAALPFTAVYKVTIDSISGKQRFED